MMQRISNSWELVKASWQVLRADKELMLFPILSFLASVLVIVTFIVPMAMAGVLDNLAGNVEVFAPVVGFLFYLVLYFVTIFSNTALVGAAMIRLNGGDPTVRDGIRIAMKHLPAIAGYALIAATVGMILRSISERSGLLGRIVAGLIGFAWGLATFLVVPVLVVEEVGPIDAIKRSANLLKRTWGEQIAGNFGIGTIFGLAILLVIIAFIPLFVLVSTLESGIAFVTVFGLFAAVLAALGLLSSTLSGIYAAAVYRYATIGDAGEFFDPEIVKNTFKQK